MASRRFWFQRTDVARGRRDGAPSRRAAVLLSSAGIIGTMVSFAGAGAGASAVAAAPVITHAPRVAVGNPHAAYNTWSASNWSGYAETGSYTGVSGSWTVPSVSATSSATYSSVWIGVDGFNNSNLIQTGTEEDYYNGAPHYNAWWEILPAAETAISSSAYPVAPGDRMSASIYETSSVVTVQQQQRFHRTSVQEHVWAIAITDATKGWSFATSQAYGGAGTSAEWIVEAPQVGGRIAPLAHYAFGNAGGLGTTTGDFDNAGISSTIVSSAGTPSYSGAGLAASGSGVMIQNNVQVSTPSSPDVAATAYNASYGASAPGVPVS